MMHFLLSKETLNRIMFLEKEIKNMQLDVQKYIRETLPKIPVDDYLQKILLEIVYFEDEIGFLNKPRELNVVYQKPELSFWQEQLQILNQYKKSIHQVINKKNFVSPVKKDSLIKFLETIDVSVAKLEEASKEYEATLEEEKDIYEEYEEVFKEDKLLLQKNLEKLQELKEAEENLISANEVELEKEEIEGSDSETSEKGPSLSSLNLEEDIEFIYKEESKNETGEEITEKEEKEIIEKVEDYPLPVVFSFPKFFPRQELPFIPQEFFLNLTAEKDGTESTIKRMIGNFEKNQERNFFKNNKDFVKLVFSGKYLDDPIIKSLPYKIKVIYSLCEVFKKQNKAIMPSFGKDYKGDKIGFKEGQRIFKVFSGAFEAFENNIKEEKKLENLVLAILLLKKNYNEGYFSEIQKLLYQNPMENNEFVGKIKNFYFLLGSLFQIDVDPEDNKDRGIGDIPALSFKDINYLVNFSGYVFESIEKNKEELSKIISFPKEFDEEPGRNYILQVENLVRKEAQDFFNKKGYWAGGEHTRNVREEIDAFTKDNPYFIEEMEEENRQKISFLENKIKEVEKEKFRRIILSFASAVKEYFKARILKQAKIEIDLNAIPQTWIDGLSSDLTINFEDDWREENEQKQIKRLEPERIQLQKEEDIFIQSKELVAKNIVNVLNTFHVDPEKNKFFAEREMRDFLTVKDVFEDFLSMQLYFLYLEKGILLFPTKFPDDLKIINRDMQVLPGMVDKILMQKNTFELNVANYETFNTLFTKVQDQINKDRIGLDYLSSFIFVKTKSGFQKIVKKFKEYTNKKENKELRASLFECGEFLKNNIKDQTKIEKLLPNIVIAYYLAKHLIGIPDFLKNIFGSSEGLNLSAMRWPTSIGDAAWMAGNNPFVQVFVLRYGIRPAIEFGRELMQSFAEWKEEGKLDDLIKIEIKNLKGDASYLRGFDANKNFYNEKSEEEKKELGWKGYFTHKITDNLSFFGSKLETQLFTNVLYSEEAILVENAIENKDAIKNAMINFNNYSASAISLMVMIHENWEKVLLEKMTVLNVQNNNPNKSKIFLELMGVFSFSTVFAKNPRLGSIFLDRYLFKGSIRSYQEAEGKVDRKTYSSMQIDVLSDNIYYFPFTFFRNIELMKTKVNEDIEKQEEIKFFKETGFFRRKASIFISSLDNLIKKNGKSFFIQNLAQDGSDNFALLPFFEYPLYTFEEFKNKDFKDVAQEFSGMDSNIKFHETKKLFKNFYNSFKLMTFVLYRNKKVKDIENFHNSLLFNNLYSIIINASFSMVLSPMSITIDFKTKFINAIIKTMEGENRDFSENLNALTYLIKEVQKNLEDNHYFFVLNSVYYYLNKVIPEEELNKIKTLSNFFRSFMGEVFDTQFITNDNIKDILEKKSKGEKSKEVVFNTINSLKDLFSQNFFFENFDIKQKEAIKQEIVEPEENKAVIEKVVEEIKEQQVEDSEINRIIDGIQLLLSDNSDVDELEKINNQEDPSFRDDYIFLKELANRGFISPDYANISYLQKLPKEERSKTIRYIKNKHNPAANSRIITDLTLKKMYSDIQNENENENVFVKNEEILAKERAIKEREEFLKHSNNKEQDNSFNTGKYRDNIFTDIEKIQNNLNKSSLADLTKHYGENLPKGSMQFATNNNKIVGRKNLKEEKKEDPNSFGQSLTEEAIKIVNNQPEIVAVEEEKKEKPIEVVANQGQKQNFASNLHKAALNQNNPIPPKRKDSPPNNVNSVSFFNNENVAKVEENRFNKILSHEESDEFDDENARLLEEEKEGSELSNKESSELSNFEHQNFEHEWEEINQEDPIDVNNRDAVAGWVGNIASKGAEMAKGAGKFGVRQGKKGVKWVKDNPGKAGVAAGATALGLGLGAYFLGPEKKKEKEEEEKSPYDRERHDHQHLNTPKKRIPIRSPGKYGTNRGNITKDRRS